MVLYSFQLMLFGLIGVFGALALLCLSVMAMTALFPPGKGEDGD